MKKTIYKIEEIKWLNEETNNTEVCYYVEFINIDGWTVTGHFDTEEEAEEYLVQQIAIKQSFKVS